MASDIQFASFDGDKNPPVVAIYGGEIAEIAGRPPYVRSRRRPVPSSGRGRGGSMECPAKHERWLVSPGEPAARSADRPGQRVRWETPATVVGRTDQGALGSLTA